MSHRERGFQKRVQTFFQQLHDLLGRIKISAIGFKINLKDMFCFAFFRTNNLKSKKMRRFKSFN